MVVAAPERRISRLSTVSAKRVIEPDVDVTGDFRPGQILPDELLITSGLDLQLSTAAKATLSREQTAALLDGGIRLESVLLGGVGLLLACWPDLTDPRVTYLLHEVGEETRHSRLFARMVEQLAPRATNPFHRGPALAVTRRIYRLIMNNPALLGVMVLAGEEVPDLVQRRQLEHPDTDDYVRRVNAYHREEEARHIAFARILLPELWLRATRRQRFLVARVAPVLVDLMLETQLFHPGIYEAAGLPARRTARAVQRGESYRRLRAEAMRPVLKAWLMAAPERRRRVPRGWRRICSVDRSGQPVAA
jgi:P-aminobenzoate N-oxygenase AurF